MGPWHSASQMLLNLGTVSSCRPNLSVTHRVEFSWSTEQNFLHFCTSGSLEGHPPWPAEASNKSWDATNVFGCGSKAQPRQARARDRWAAQTRAPRPPDRIPAGAGFATGVAVADDGMQNDEEEERE